MNLSVGEAVPAFSVVIPLYNKRPYIRRAVESVLQQSFKDFELIVVDDGSTDGSAEVLVDIADPRMRLVRQDNQGVGSARNAGINLARSDWVALLDADDAWLPSHLAELSRVSKFCPQAGLISTSCVEACEGDIPFERINDKKTSIIQEVDYFLEAARNIGFINSTSAAVQRNAVVAIGLFTDRRTGEDLECWIKLALRYPVAVSDKVTCVYFRDSGGVMQQVAQQRLAEVQRPIMTFREFSTPVAVLCEAAGSDPSIWSRASIRKYVNGALYLAIKGSLYRGDIENARNFGQMLLPPLGFKFMVMRWVMNAPACLLRLLLSAMMKFKQRVN